MRRLLSLISPFALAACMSTTASRPPAPAYAVFFAARSAALEPAAVDVIAQVARAAPGHAVTVLGWTDSVGSKPDDVVLSRQRATRVADALVADGVPAASITRQGRGQTGTDPGVESRRVDITLSN